jgi:hypothetical protein
MRTKPCESCETEMVFLRNYDTGRWVPVDVDSLTEDDVRDLEDRHAPNPSYSKDRGHVSHYETCDDPDRFSRET